MENMDRIFESIAAETRSLNQPAALLSNDPANSCSELAAGDDSPLELLRDLRKQLEAANMT